MESRLIDLSKYRYEAALDDLETARNNLRDGKLKQAVNRSYYAIFHTLRAVTALDEFDSGKHSGVISYFNKNYVKEGIFDGNISKMIKKAFTIREKADYEDFYVVSKKEAQEQIEDSEKIMETIKVYLEKRWNTDK